jgi:hypothetical protein
MLKATIEDETDAQILTSLVAAAWLQPVDPDRVASQDGSANTIVSPLAQHLRTIAHCDPRSALSRHARWPKKAPGLGNRQLIVRREMSPFPTARHLLSWGRARCPPRRGACACASGLVGDAQKE